MGGKGRKGEGVVFSSVFNRSGEEDEESPKGKKSNNNNN
jgi:hypothetical protein